MQFIKPQANNFRNGRAFGSTSKKAGLWLFLFLSQAMTKFKSVTLAMGLALSLILPLTGCEAPRLHPNEVEVLVNLDLPPGIPEMKIEPGNELTVHRVELGKKLFFDPSLSRDYSVSCGSCHHQDKAFADYFSVSEGVAGRMGKRNTPALFNLGWHQFFNRDGGTVSLETQMLVPFQAHVEMDMTFSELNRRIGNDEDYKRLFELAYPEHGVSSYAITRAVGAYQRVLTSFDSPYDRYIYYGEQEALTEAQKRGKDLFFSDRTNCANCHGNFDFRSDELENNGLYKNYADSGLASITVLPEDRGRFKIPSLRNVEVTAPYMHDGSLWSLSEVIDHYASGGQGHPNQSPLIAGFEITEVEKSDLISFLMALTDQTFLSNPYLVP